jgi:hypothetical protein
MNVIYKTIETLLKVPITLKKKKKGIIKFRIKFVRDWFINDFLYYKKANLKEKFWAYKKGFISDRIHRYGLTENNYHEYISDLTYYNKKSYVNRRFYSMFDNKLITWYVLQPYKEYMPEHYCFIDNDKINKLSENYIINNVEDIISLLHNKKELAMKPIFGSMGKGFSKLSYIDNCYYINYDKKSCDEIIAYIKSRKNYIITEYCNSHVDLQKICGEDEKGKRPFVPRVVTVFDKEDSTQIVAFLARIGSNLSKFIITTDGTIVCGIDLDKGTLYKPFIEAFDKLRDSPTLTPCKIHPDTNVNIEGVEIPNWSKITTKIKEIGNYLNVTPYLTYDIIITDNGFKILEINQHSRIFNLQIYYPLLKNDYVKRLWSHLLKE